MTPGGRPLRPIDRLVKAPAGFLWLGVIAVLALPVMLLMTAFYYLARTARAARG